MKILTHAAAACYQYPANFISQFRSANLFERALKLPFTGAALLRNKVVDLTLAARGNPKVTLLLFAGAAISFTLFRYSSLFLKLQSYLENAQSCFLLGSLSEGSEPNQARRYYKKAARLGHAQAAFNLARMYETGAGGTQNNTKARELYSSDLLKEHQEAKFNLARMLLNGVGGNMDSELALNLLGELAELGHAAAMFKLSTLLFKSGNHHERAKALLKSAADLGHILAQVRYADLLIREDKDKDAFPLYKLAAEAGHARAKRLVGFLYIYTAHAPEGANVLEGLNWLEAASAAGDGEAAYYHGEMYLEGKLVGLDIDRALRSFECAVNYGSSNGQYALGYCYLKGLRENGNEVKLAQDLHKAFKLFELAAQQNHRLALEQLATFYSEGKVVEKDPAEARKLQARAAALKKSD